ncbi:MAG: hypothetical protein ACD_28C00198G0004 [uncultured bacterium]|nr:MAG: hypothetical protein ACD_28C00198G0004 [uncultured bacterium]
MRAQQEKDSTPETQKAKFERLFVEVGRARYDYQESKEALEKFINTPVGSLREHVRGRTGRALQNIGDIAKETDELKQEKESTQTAKESTEAVLINELRRIGEMELDTKTLWFIVTNLYKDFPGERKLLRFFESQCTHHLKMALLYGPLKKEEGTRLVEDDFEIRFGEDGYQDLMMECVIKDPTSKVESKLRGILGRPHLEVLDWDNRKKETFLRIYRNSIPGDKRTLSEILTSFKEKKE